MRDLYIPFVFGRLRSCEGLKKPQMKIIVYITLHYIYLTLYINKCTLSFHRSGVLFNKFYNRFIIDKRLALGRFLASSSLYNRRFRMLVFSFWLIFATKLDLCLFTNECTSSVLAILRRSLFLNTKAQESSLRRYPPLIIRLRKDRYIALIWDSCVLVQHQVWHSI